MLFRKKESNKLKKENPSSNFENYVKKSNNNPKNGKFDYKENKTKEIILKVAEAYQDDLNYNIVMMDTSSMSQIGVRPGDYVEVEGNRKTVAKVELDKASDLNLMIVRMDSITRKNARTTIGENVIIRPAKVNEAIKITIAPLANNVKIDSTLLSKLISGKVIVKGDLIKLGNPTKKTFDVFGDEFMRLMLDGFPGTSIFGFGELRFMVINTIPENYVVITENTNINISSKIILEKDLTTTPTILKFSLGLKRGDDDIDWLVTYYDSFPIQKSKILNTTKDYENSIDFDLILDQSGKKYLLKHFSFPVLPAASGKAKIKINVNVDSYGAVNISVENPPLTEDKLIYSTKELIKKPATEAEEILTAIEVILSARNLSLKKEEYENIQKIRDNLVSALESRDEIKIKTEIKESKPLLDKLTERIYSLHQDK
jgi:transitional endoplasmic reticulum ATPase